MEDNLSEAIYRTFRTSDGKTTLAYILNTCGFFETDPRLINPELIAFCHTLLRAGGMTIEGDMGLFTSAIVESHNLGGLARSNTDV